MGDFAWKSSENDGIIRNGPGGASTPFPTLEHRQPEKEAVHMSLWVHIGDSRQHFKTERFVNGGAA